MMIWWKSGVIIIICSWVLSIFVFSKFIKILPDAESSFHSKMHLYIQFCNFQTLCEKLWYNYMVYIHCIYINIYTYIYIYTRIYIYTYIYIYILSYVNVSCICVYILHLLYMYYEFVWILFSRSMTLKKTLLCTYKAYILNIELSKLKTHFTFLLLCPICPKFKRWSRFHFLRYYHPLWQQRIITLGT